MEDDFKKLNRENAQLEQSNIELSKLLVRQLEENQQLQEKIKRLEDTIVAALNVIDQYNPEVVKKL